MGPKLLDDIEVGNKTSAPVIQKIAGDYGSRILPRNHALPDPESVKELRAGLFAATHKLGFHVPAVHALQMPRFFYHHDRTQSCHKVPVVACMPALLHDLSARIAVNQEIAVCSFPTPIALVGACSSPPTMPLALAVDKLIESLRFSDDDIATIEAITRGQSSNINWYHQKMGSVTASAFGNVVKFMTGSKVSEERLVSACIDAEHDRLSIPPRPKKPALKWGVVNEQKAREKCSESMSKVHENYAIMTSGIVVHKQYPFLRASPDGIVSFGNEKKLLEIKCPYSIRHLCPKQAVLDHKIDYVGVSDSGNFFLKQSSRGYHE